nr:hypothetical protein [Microvirga aerophila]
MNQVLHPVLVQDRKEILFLEISQEVQLLLQVRKQALTGFGCVVGGGEELIEEFVGFIRRRLAEGSGGHFASKDGKHRKEKDVTRRFEA